MTQKSSPSRRIHSYDFFQGVLMVGLIFYMTFFQFSPLAPQMEVFYRWASLGFLFFSGIISGEILWRKKNASFFFFRRGLQVFALFMGVNILSFFSQHSFHDWEAFSLQIIQGDAHLVANLLLPLAAFFLISPLIRFIPPLLGVLWGGVGFLLLDVLAIEKDIFFLNALFLLTVAFGFFVGRVSSLDQIRIYFHTNFPYLPFLFLYLAIGILVMGELLLGSFFELLSVFWSFHLLISFLLYLSLPSLLFVGEAHKPALRTFFETLGVEMFFVYVFSSFFLYLLGALFLGEKLSSSDLLPAGILAIHMVILLFGVVSLLRKYFKKSPRLKKCFRFIF